MQPLLSAISFWDKIWFTLNEWDTWLFLQINNHWTNDLFDSIFPWWRESVAWAPLYVFLIALVFVNFKKQAWYIILFVLITVTLSDQISSNLLKKWIERPRPCNDAALLSEVRLLLNHCSGGYSFTSSHATNHFAISMFLFMTMRSYFGKWIWAFFIWSASICYGQVYVGVHYPLDVFCGALLGLGIGWLTGTAFLKQQASLELT